MDKERHDSAVTRTVQPDPAKQPAKHASGFSRAVAIGVGPSGVDELTALVSALRPGNDLAYIVVQHGSPSSPDTLTELISSVCELRVSRLQYGAQLTADEVRVAPPGYAVELQGARLQLELPPEPSERRTVIDRLFRSLARSVGARGVGVVLPGTGTDGSLGARALAREGGAVFAADGTQLLPNSATAGADQTTHVFSPQEIAQLLQQPSALSAYAAGMSKSRAPGTSQTARLAAEKVALQERFDELQRAHAEITQRLAASEQRLAAAQARDNAWRNAQAQQHRLLSAAAIGVIVLDAQLRVESVNGDVSGVYKLTQADIGQPLAARSQRVQDMPGLPVLDSLRPGSVQEANVVTADRWYLRRVVPRYDGSGRIPIGMTLVFIDVTQLKRGTSTTGQRGSSSVMSYVDHVDGPASRTSPQ